MQDCFKAHPEVYKPMDELDDDDDDLDPTSMEALETGTKEGVMEHDQKRTERKPEGEKEVNWEHQRDKRPKQGDERKNENIVARSG